MYLVPSNAWGSLRERGGDGHLFWIVLLAGVGLNSSGDPGWVSSCWDLVLWKEVGLLVGLSGGGGEGGWSWGGVRGRDMGWDWGGCVAKQKGGRATVNIF